MVDRVDLTSALTQPLRPTGEASNKITVPANAPGFDDILKSQLNQPTGITFSAHAQRRIASRDIEFGAEETSRLEQAVEKAANKGSRESLILMDDLALVVSIKNKVVITAVDANNRKDNVFTNIDSVVLT
jgi:flagellar operon protein